MADVSISVTRCFSSTGKNCSPWSGGRSDQGAAVPNMILIGAVILATVTLRYKVTMSSSLIYLAGRLRLDPGSLMFANGLCLGSILFSPLPDADSSSAVYTSVLLTSRP